MSHRLAFLFSLLPLATVVVGQEPTIKTHEYCIKFFGGVSAEVLVGEGWQGRNYNGTIRCPDSWRFPSMRGAIMTLCPVSPDGPIYSPGTSGLAIDAKLEFHHRSGLLSRPIDQLALQDFLVTNGSVPGPWEEGGEPAVLAPHAWDPRQNGPHWTINGTERALISAPTNSSKRNSVYLDCANLPAAQQTQYCGTGEDIDVGGCWSRQYFILSMQDAMNFTFRFSNYEASALIYTTMDWVYENGTNMGPSTAVIRFGGERELPSVVDYDFWTNSEANYEFEQANLNNMEFVPDHAGMPLFLNRTESGEWYDTMNGTFSVPSSSDASGLAEGRLMWISVISLVAVLGVDFWR
ncbi:hypothetical protein MFIFM68171_05839 [Madurella fahalii]|uniref:Uncharacterized protein n=1 Tax=Madurella fahalii TaxID=1157608 RepID=A0ABQ0GD57_9PEZI